MPLRPAIGPQRHLLLAPCAAVGFSSRRAPPVCYVCADLTDECESHGSLLRLQLTRPTFASPDKAFAVRSVRTLCRGMLGKGISTGTFLCAAADGCSSPNPSEQGLACLKNVDLDLSAMPTLEQVHGVIQHYGPMLYFHPKEIQAAQLSGEHDEQNAQ